MTAMRMNDQRLMQEAFFPDVAGTLNFER